MPDGGETFQGEDHTGVALSYGSLPCTQKCPSAQGQRPLDQHLGGGASSLSGCWLQLSHTARQTVTLPDKQKMHLGFPGQSDKGLQEDFLQQPLQYQMLESYSIKCRPPSSTDYSTLRAPWGLPWNSGHPQGCPVPPARAKVPGPKRVDMPPEEDWRQNSYTPQPGGRRKLPVRVADGAFSSASEARRNIIARVAAAAATRQNNGW